MNLARTLFLTDGNRTWVALFLALPLTPLLVSCRTAHPGPQSHAQPALVAYEQRISLMRAQIPAIVRSAEAAAAAMHAHPEAFLYVPFAGQSGFGQELASRAGGLSQLFPPARGRNAVFTTNDLVLLSARTWESDRTNVVARLQEYRAKGWQTILFASEAGRPTEANAEFFIDNGSKSGDAAQGRINALANSTLSWMWCCEYVAALTRKGKIPGIFLSIALDESTAHNTPLRGPEGRHWYGDCATPISAGQLAELYLQRIERLVADLRSPRTQSQLRKAAEIVAKRMDAGNVVALSSMGHLTIFEALETDYAAPWKLFRSVSHPKTAFKENLNPGDLLVWIGYIGINSGHADFATPINETGADVITCYTPVSDAYGAVSNVLAHIDQSWAMGDAEIPLPCPPGRMAPISGINAVLLMRMLDDEVVARMKKR